MSLSAAPAIDPVAPGERRSLAADQAGWLFAFVMVGYPTFGMLAAFLDVESTTFSIPYRIIVLLWSALVAALAIGARTVTAFPRLVALVWAMYLLRLSWDTWVADVFQAGNSYIFFLVTSLVPATALALLADKWDDAAVARKVALVGAVSCTLGVAADAFGLAAARSTTLAMEGRMSFDAVNPIIFGHTGLITLIAGLAWARATQVARARIWALAGAAIGALCLVLAASRGPFVAAAVVAVTYLFVKRRWGVLLCLAVVAALTVGVIPWLDLGAATRFVGMDRDESALGRLALQSAAINDFWTHPLTGVAYIEPYFNNYPHNMIVESAMALGVGGLLAVVIVTAKTCWRAVRLIRRDMLCLSLVGLEALVGQQFSGSMYGAAPTWVTMVILLGMHLQTREATPSAAAIATARRDRWAARPGASTVLAARPALRP